MKESDLIYDAYAGKLAELFKAMFLAYLSAAGDVVKENKAETSFKDGLALARKVRDRALALL